MNDDEERTEVIVAMAFCDCPFCVEDEASESRPAAATVQVRPVQAEAEGGS